MRGMLDESIRPVSCGKTGDCHSIAGAAGFAGRACRAVLAHEHRVSSAGAPDARLARFREAATAAGLRVETLATETESGRGVSVLEVKLVEAL